MYTKKSQARERPSSALAYAGRMHRQLAIACASTTEREALAFEEFRDTPEERLQFLNQEIQSLRDLLAEELCDPWDFDEIRELKQQLDYYQAQKSELVWYFQELSKLGLTEEAPRYCDEWMTWAQRKIGEHRQKARYERRVDEEPAPNYEGWLQWARSKRTIVLKPLRQGAAKQAETRVPARQPKRKKRQPALVFFRAAWGRFALILRLARKR